ncbi:MAG: NAD(P)/FAD-dependent oxidoreductase [Chryseobacterium sp.]|uniref:phytoene desaturase family protein n=1 Tax=Chryseobacterium sp. TaxID=1871047 RepID=UPI0025C58B3A|nr:NAD(P)/FAD-dependent oxidoreductase [Chryseobacterium sp.]MCJ7934765.1 NAD(P)/FAD-dependent oxidoreductase [Chryseobacterium sp.]
MSTKLNVYDVIIIGSGLGSIACASFIAQMYNLKVLVVEQNKQAGGLSQAIVTDQDVELEIGIHQVGELEADSIFSKLMSYISDGKSSWRRLPDTFIKFHFPDFVYEVTAGEADQIYKLSRLFPSEEVNIHQYYRDIEQITKWYRNFTTESLNNDKSRMLKLLDLKPGKMAMMTTEAYLNHRFTNEKLKSLIASHWTDYGLPPQMSAFLKHAILVNNHKNGVYYPNFGSTQLIDSISDTIINNGGEFVFNSRVEEIIYEGKTAHSVTILNEITNEKTVLGANIIISGIGLYNTYGKLLDKNLAPEKLNALNGFKRQGVSFIKLFATLKSDPQSVGADQSLSWVYPGYDHNQNFKGRKALSKELISQFSISFPSLKKDRTTKHSMKINTLVDYDTFMEWLGNDELGENYKRIKQEIGESLLNAAEKLYPGLTELVDNWDLYTPMSATRDTKHYKGNIFGIPDTPERYMNLDFNCFTPLENVYVTGSDITTSGVYGAILSGALTASAAFKDKQFFLKVIQKVSLDKIKNKV